MKIEHIAMYVHDLEKAKEFFVKYFDGKPNEMYHNKATGFRSYFISFEDSARLEIMTRPEIMNCEEKNSKETIEKNKSIREGYVHIAFSVGSKEKVELVTERFRNDGFEVVSGPRTTGDGYYESCIIGIEGNQIEVTI